MQRTQLIWFPQTEMKNTPEWRQPGPYDCLGRCKTQSWVLIPVFNTQMLTNKLMLQSLLLFICLLAFCLPDPCLLVKLDNVFPPFPFYCDYFLFNLQNTQFLVNNIFNSTILSLETILEFYDQLKTVSKRLNLGQTSFKLSASKSGSIIWETVPLGLECLPHNKFKKE